MIPATCRRATGTWPVRRCWRSSAGGWTGERGLSAVSVRCYCKQAKAFLTAVGGPAAVGGLDAGQVPAFMVDHCRDRNTSSAKAMVTSLRAFLRFAPRDRAHSRPAGGRRSRRWLDGGWPVATSAGWQRPRSSGCWPAACQDPPWAAAITRSCRCWRGLGCAAARSPACNWAILTGERARSRTTGKGSRVERLPLLAPAGEALASVADRRPSPLRGAGGVRDRAAALPAADAGGGPSKVMSRACDRAVLQRGGERTGCATRWPPRCCAPARRCLEVGQVLRHRSELSTSVYAKVDQNALLLLARLWPCPGAGVVR